MLKKFLCAVMLLSAAASADADRQSYTIEVDKKGVMRRSDTGDEVSYYGTNYTLPFAHARRAMDYLGVDPKKAIDRDVYHFARLGLNAFRLHLWDVELADSVGNLLDNDHLDLLDYLISRLEERGIDIILTAQTDFGNGYPEKNTDTGAFAYDFDKCRIHDDPAAQKIQANYISQLVGHLNPYTGRRYADDNAIIALEINNEPCHSGTQKEVTAYINKMVRAARKGGFKRPLLYNVTHNPGLTPAYYASDIQGTTFQWYPTGLVAGHERKGNFLPNVDTYPIPWKDSMPRYDCLARIVYEFDPGDVLVSYLYPAIARTFRGEGFQWITQFAYDPTDMARFNTEYQTHFLNLAYTPAKALSMMIAAEAARNIRRGEQFGSYPDNTRFADISLDAESDLALLNATDRYYYTNSTLISPISPDSLIHIAGHGSSPVVRWPGTGAYFLDRLDSLNWRLEIMPDVVLTHDPFEKPSLTREVAQILYATHPISISLPSLGNQWQYAGVNDGNSLSGKSTDATASLSPGVYILSPTTPNTEKWNTSAVWDNKRVGEYVAPAPSDGLPVVIHSPAPLVASGDNVHIRATAVAPTGIDSLVVYPGDISFWRDDNKLYPMSRTGSDPYSWNVIIPQSSHGLTDYRIVAWSDGKPYTFPAGIPGTPLDWDFPDNQPSYTISSMSESQPLFLIDAAEKSQHLQAAVMPDGNGVWIRQSEAKALKPAQYTTRFSPTDSSSRLVITDYITPVIRSAPALHDRQKLTAVLADTVGIDSLLLGFVTADGTTHRAHIPVTKAVYTPRGYEFTVDVKNLDTDSTWLLPVAYPFFTAREFKPSDSAPFHIHDVESAVIEVIPTTASSTVDFTLRALILQ